MSDAKHSQKWYGLIVPLGALALLGLLMLFTSQPAQAQTGVDNATCLACHSAAGQEITFPNGDAVSITIDENHFGTSVHGTFNCTTCHADITAYPHPQVTAASAREYTNTYKETCRSCHATQYDALNDSIHGQQSAAGNLNAPLCSDCHDPHGQDALRDTQGNLMAEERLNIPQTCARCHSDIYNEYAQSVHGSALLQNNTDVATCTDCHGVHSIGDPTSNAYRLNSPQVCADCHTDTEKMKKYGLNTGVLDTYVADFHGTTVTLFERTSPDQPTNKPVCFDCHGIHNIKAVDDPNGGLSIRENLIVTCQRCHPDADTKNFPDSWLGHYTPDQQKYPLVYWVNLIYLILIPLVLGAMLVFNLSDVYHRLRTRSKKHTPAAAAAQETPTAPPAAAAELETAPVPEVKAEEPAVEPEPAPEETPAPEIKEEPAAEPPAADEPTENKEDVQ